MDLLGVVPTSLNRHQSGTSSLQMTPKVGANIVLSRKDDETIHPDPALWFFCAGAIPTSHCASGMVGYVHPQHIEPDNMNDVVSSSAINPPSVDMYNKFRDAAKLVVGTPEVRIIHTEP